MTIKIIKFLILATPFVLVFIIFRPRGWGFVLGEPDEFIYMKLAESWRNLHWPIYGGQPFYYDLPLFPLVAALLSSANLNYLAAVRAVSYAAVFLTAGVLLYWRWKMERSLTLAVLNACLFLLLPFSVFYSQIGVLDPFSTFWLFSSLIFFQLAQNERKTKFFLLAGLCLGLAILVKYTALVLFALISLYFLFHSVKLTLAQNWRERWCLDCNSGLTLFIAVLLSLPPLLLYRLKDSWIFAVQTSSIFGLHGETAFVLFPKKLTFLPEWFTGTNLDYWFGWPLLLLVVVGLLFNLSRWHSRSFFLLTFGIYLYLILGRIPFHPRYLFPLLPFVSYFAVDGLRIISWKKVRVLLAFSFLLLLWSIPRSFAAWQAARHALLERSVAAVGLPRENFSGFVFTNYWPNFYIYLAQTDKVSWLANNKREIEAFYPSATDEAFTLLEQDGGYIFLEDHYSHYIVQPSARTEAVARLQEARPPSLVVGETAPNFPFFPDSSNKVEVYQFKKGERL